MSENSPSAEVPTVHDRVQGEAIVEHPPLSERSRKRNETVCLCSGWHAFYRICCFMLFCALQISYTFLYFVVFPVRLCYILTVLILLVQLIQGYAESGNQRGWPGKECE